MKHRCKVRKMQTGNLWKVQCWECPLLSFGIRFFPSWERAFDFAFTHAKESQ